MIPADLPADGTRADFVLVPLQPAGPRQRHRWAMYCTSHPGAGERSPAACWGPYIEPNTDPRAATRAAAAAWPRMVYSPRPADPARDAFPAFHFVLPFGAGGSWGMDSHVARLSWELARHLARPVRLSVLTGWHPNSCDAAPDDAAPADTLR